MWRVLGSLCVAVEESLNGFCRRMFEYGGRFGGGWMGLWDGICIDDSVQILEGWEIGAGDCESQGKNGSTNRSPRGSVDRWL